MNQEELEVWYKGCTEHYRTFSTKPVVEQTPQPKEILINGKEYLNIIEEIIFINQFCWVNRPMNCYLIKFKNVQGNFTLNIATAAEQEQPIVGTIVRHYITGTKITQFKIVKI